MDAAFSCQQITIAWNLHCAAVNSCGGEDILQCDSLHFKSCIKLPIRTKILFGRIQLESLYIYFHWNVLVLPGGKWCHWNVKCFDFASYLVWTIMESILFIQDHFYPNSTNSSTENPRIRVGIAKILTIYWACTHEWLSFYWATPRH